MGHTVSGESSLVFCQGPVTALGCAQPRAWDSAGIQGAHPGSPLQLCSALLCPAGSGGSSAYCSLPPGCWPASSVPGCPLPSSAWPAGNCSTPISPESSAEPSPHHQTPGILLYIRMHSESLSRLVSRVTLRLYPKTLAIIQRVIGHGTSSLLAA